MSASTHTVKIKGRELKLSNLEKVLFAKSQFTKAEVIEYYTRVSDVVIPHLKERPLTLKRYPDGVEGMHFYEKQCPRFRPEWFETYPHQSEVSGREINFCVVNDIASLIWIANLASIELHVLLSKRRDYNKPTMMVFDMDPGEPAGLIEAAGMAIKVRDYLEEQGLKCFAKTSGKKGIHLAVPINRPVTFEVTKEYSRQLAEEMEARHPKLVTSIMSKAKRKGKVFIDWSQNTPHKTTVCAYSLRAVDPPGVSTPVEWDELEMVVKKKDPNRIKFSPADVLKRVETKGDLWREVLTKKQKVG